MVSLGADVDHVRSLVAAEPVEPDDQPAASGWLQRMCRAASRHLPAWGVGVTLLSDGGEPMTTVASTQRSARVEELQLSLGEGPCLLAYSTRAPVLVPALDELEGSVWPAYARAAQEHGIHAVFAFPLQVGAVRLGALDVYRERRGDTLSSAALAQALTFAVLSVEVLLDAGSSPEQAASLVDDSPGTRYEVYQAQGMVMAQLGIGGAEAMARLRARAFAEGRPLAAVAQDVVRRTLDVEDDDP